MVWRRIFVPLHGEDEDHVALAAAGRLADDFKAHLDVVLIKPDPASYVPPVGIGKLADEIRAELVQAAEDSWAETEEALLGEFQTVASKEGLTIVDAPQGPGSASARFTALTPDDAEEAGLRYARASDAVVVSMPSKRHRNGGAAFAQRMLLKSGRPVLSIPGTGLPREINRVGIAWDHDDEVVRAVSSAMSFLAMASMVDVVTVADNVSADAHPEDMVEYFAWRGVPAQAHRLEPNYKTVGERLVEFMEAQNWDMIVMGAYGRGHFIERFFAGPTRGVPWKATAPVLQAH